MEFDNSFNVPLPPDRAWATLMDIERIAPCMPGAELTEKVDDSTYKGKVSVRLGPVALTFQGTAAFEEIDNDAHTAKVKAQGSDAKGRGGANADVGFTLTDAGDGTSKVDIHTDLQLSGSVAQYGRGVGMIQDLSSRLIGQFADNLAKQLEAEQAAPEADAAPTDPAASASGDAPAAPAPADSAPSPPQDSAPPVQMAGMGLSVLWGGFVRWIKGLFGSK